MCDDSPLESLLGRGLGGLFQWGCVLGGGEGGEGFRDAFLDNIFLSFVVLILSNGDYSYVKWCSSA